MAKKKYTSGFLAIENDKGLRGVFSTLGAGVYSLTLHGKPLILQPKDKEVYLSSPQFFGKTMGRVIGRMAKDIKIFGQEYHLLGGDDGICLHGGEYESLSYKDFQGVISSHGEDDGVEFTYVSPDGECGFPGRLTVKISYVIPKETNELIIRQEATTTKETVVSLSNHMYWNVFGDENVNDYVLKARASRVGVFKEGTQLVVDSKPVPDYLDFHEGVLLKDCLDRIQKAPGEIKTLDHAFLFDSVESEEPQVVLDTPHVIIQCFTNYDGVNLYVDTTDSPVEFANGNVHGRRAIAIEPQCFPLEPRVLLSNEVYRHEIRYRILEK